jgi:hypothetical protein
MPPSSRLVDQLKAQIRAMRATLDPRVLNWAQQKLVGEGGDGAAQPGPETRASADPDKEAFDREGAKAALEIFLKARSANPSFVKKLKAKLAEPPQPEETKPYYRDRDGFRTQQRPPKLPKL